MQTLREKNAENRTMGYIHSSFNLELSLKGPCACRIRFLGWASSRLEMNLDTSNIPGTLKDNYLQGNRTNHIHPAKGCIFRGISSQPWYELKERRKERRYIALRISNNYLVYWDQNVHYLCSLDYLCSKMANWNLILRSPGLEDSPGSIISNVKSFLAKNTINLTSKNFHR